MKQPTKEIVYREDEVASLVIEGGKLVFKKSAEDELLKLLDLKDKIDAAIEQAKNHIAEAGKKVSPDFKGVAGSKLRAIYKVSGETYTYDRMNVPEDFMKTITWRKVDSQKVKEYVEEFKELPEGIIENEREAKLIIIKKNEDAKTLP